MLQDPRSFITGAGIVLASACAGMTARADKGKKNKTTAVEDLEQEHGLIQRLLPIYDKAIRHLRDGKDVDLRHVHEAAGIMHKFVEEYHEKEEEEYLFPRFEKGKLAGVGGLVGNQGGIRSAAPLGFGLPKEALVATVTAIGLLVDIFCMPVYAATEYADMLSAGKFILIATVASSSALLSASRCCCIFRSRCTGFMLSGIILPLGVWMFIHPGG